jgi:uncharacterized membrane protein YfcA
LLFSPETLALLAAAAFVAGFIDAIAGGGGLVTVPALMLAGLDPVTAVATNKLSATFGAVSATLAFARRGLIDWRVARNLCIMSFIGSVAGAAVAVSLPAAWLAGLVPVLLIVTALYVILRPALSDTARPPRIGAGMFAMACALPIGAYDGFFGPGAGSLFLLCCVTLLGMGAVKAVGLGRALNLASGLGSLLFFIAAGKVVWPLGLVMGVSQYAGSYCGSRAAIAGGARLIRPVLVVVCIAMALKLLSDQSNPLRVAVGL